MSKGQLGLNHVALQVEDMDALTGFYQRFKEYDVPMDHLTDHGMTSSIYFYDPDGIMLEFFCNTTATAEEGLALMRSPGRKNRELILEDVTA